MRIAPCLALCVFLGAPTLATAVECLPYGALNSGHIRYVIDGDTVILDSGRHIRLIGLNAPEIGHHGASSDPFADAARTALKKRLIKADYRIQWSYGPQRHDRYGRTLAHLYVHGIDAAKALLRAGLAAVIAIPPNIKRARCYSDAERTARRDERGIWAPDADVVRTATEPAGAGFEIVTGPITQVKHKRSGTQLMLGNHLQLWIPRADLHFFQRPVKTLIGRKVLVRGWRYPFHGKPEIVVHHPIALTIQPTAH